MNTLVTHILYIQLLFLEKHSADEGQILSDSSKSCRHEVCEPKLKKKKKTNKHKDPDTRTKLSTFLFHVSGFLLERSLWKSEEESEDRS